MRSLTLIALAVAATPALELLDREPAFSETRVFIGIAGKDATIRDGNQDFSLVETTLGIQAINAYSDRPRQDAGILAGAGVLGRYWHGDSKGITYDAGAPIVALDLGGYLKPAKNIRFDLYGEAGAGLAFARIQAGNAPTESTQMRPFPHLSGHFVTTLGLSKSTNLGLDAGYDWDRLPDVTVTGPSLAVVFQVSLGGNDKAEK